MNTTSLSLIERVARDPDAESWNRLSDLYVPLLRRWVRRFQLQHADAADVVQEVLAVVVRDVSDFQHNKRKGAFRAWLRQILLNRLREFRRSPRFRSEAAGGSGPHVERHVPLRDEDKPIPDHVPVVEIREGITRPRVVVIRGGQPIKVQNHDAKPHSIRYESYGDTSGEGHVHLIPPRGSAQFTPAPTFPIPFDSHDELDARCRFWVFAPEHPYATFTDREGRFEIRNIPAGETELRFWHESCGYLEVRLEWERGIAPVTIKAGETVDLGDSEIPVKLLMPKEWRESKSTKLHRVNRNVTAIVLTDAKTANRVWGLARKNQDPKYLERVAARHSVINAFIPGRLDPPPAPGLESPGQRFLEAVQALKPGEVFAVIAHQKHFYILIRKPNVESAPATKPPPAQPGPSESAKDNQVQN